MKTTAMHMILGAALVAFTMAAGCLSIKVEDHGYEALLNPDGSVVVDKKGTAQLVHKGQTWRYYKHWFEQTAERISFSRKPGDDISFDVRNYRDVVSAELDKVIETSFKGVAELTAKVAAAVATSGGSTAASGAISAAVARFVAKGGDTSSATVTCKDGSCTISDGSVTETCANCAP